MSKKEKILDLVKKLLAMTKSPNENESAIAAAKVQELLFKYKLSLSEVESFNDSKNSNGVTHNHLDIMSLRNQGQWKRFLIRGVAQYNFCDTLLDRGFRDKNINVVSYVILGKPEDIEVVIELYKWLVLQIEEVVLKACVNYTGLDRIPTFRRSFYMGAVDIICARLQEKWNSLRSQDSQSTALVVRTESYLSEYTEKNFKVHISSIKNPRNSSSDGYYEGVERGKNINLEMRKKVENIKKPVSTL